MLQTNILTFLIELDFEGVNRLFILKFHANDIRIGHPRYFLPTAIVEDHNVMIDGKRFLINQLKMI